MKTSASRHSGQQKKHSGQSSFPKKIPYQYTHDINALLSGLEQIGFEIPLPLRDAVTLTSFASDTRYPGTATPVTKEEYHAAVRLAQEILHWAEEQAG
jgi:HEPN domain-containing protein